MTAPATFTAISVVPAWSEKMWARNVTPAGVNDELFSFLRMTVPRTLRGKSIQQIPLRRVLGRSLLLLFGVLPIDYDDLTIAELEPWRRFLERSSMLSIEHWQHERLLTALAAGCEMQDRIRFGLRRPLVWLPGMPGLVAAALRRLFAHRHRRLRRRAAAL
jgi:hypothetical protein